MPVTENAAAMATHDLELRRRIRLPGVSMVSTRPPSAVCMTPAAHNFLKFIESIQNNLPQ